MDPDRLPLGTICHNMGSQCSQWELRTHVCMGKKRFQLCPPGSNKQVASCVGTYFFPTGVSVKEVLQEQGERRHAVHLRARVAVLSSGPSSPDELAAGGGAGGGTLERKLQARRSTVVSLSVKCTELFFNCLLVWESAAAHGDTAVSFKAESLDNQRTKQDIHRELNVSICRQRS